MVTFDAASVRAALEQHPDQSGLVDKGDEGWQVDLTAADGTVRLFVELADDLAAGTAEAGEPAAKVPGLHVYTPVLSAGGGLGMDVARQALSAAADEAMVRIGWGPSPDGEGPALLAVAGLALDDLDVAELHATLTDVAETASRLQITLHAD